MVERANKITGQRHKNRGSAAAEDRGDGLRGQCGAGIAAVWNGDPAGENGKSGQCADDKCGKKNLKNAEHALTDR